MQHLLSEHRSEERRQAERRECLSPAVAVQRAPMKKIRCIVKDISETGCRLVGVDVDTVHSPFLLRAVDWEAPRECDVRWRDRKTIGVSFSLPHSEPKAASS